MAEPLPVIVPTPPAALHDDGVWRDAVRQPLYSTVGYDAAILPFQRNFFTYRTGDNVPGAGNAAGNPSTLWHTNMEIGGALAMPKKFRCDGVSVTMPPLTFEGGADVPNFGSGTNEPGFSGAATADSELLEDILVFVYSSYMRLRIGQKNYAEHPLMFFPHNIGAAGLCAVDVDRVSAAGIGHLDVTIPNTVGLGIQFGLWPFLVMPQQAIVCEITTPWGTNPPLNRARAVQVFLHGNYHREVQ